MGTSEFLGQIDNGGDFHPWMEVPTILCRVSAVILVMALLQKPELVTGTDIANKISGLDKSLEFKDTKAKFHLVPSSTSHTLEKTVNAAQINDIICKGPTGLEATC